MPADELITVVMPCLDEEGFISRALASIQQQTHRELQILVVDGGSRDATPEIVADLAKSDHRIEFVENPSRTIPVALNLALARARSSWLVRVDAHSTVEPGYVAASVARLRDGSCGGVGGRKDGVGTTAAGRAIAAVMASPFGVGNSVYHYGTEVQEVDHIPFGAYPVDVAREIGGWNETLIANEDYEFDYRIRLTGRRLLFDPALRIEWVCQQSIGDLYRQYVRYGRGKLDVARLHPRSMRLRHVVAPAFVGWLALGVVVCPRHPGRLLAMLAPYGLALAAASARTAGELDTAEERSYVPAAFVAMHVGWGVGFWAALADTARSELRR